VVEDLLSFEATQSTGRVSAILRRPEPAKCLYVLAHGAGAGMNHAFMESMAEALSERNVATFRYQFPYMEAGRGAPNPRPILLQTVRSAVAEAKRLASDLPVIAGGKSMGGRMTSLAASEGLLEGVSGLVFLGFPLHAAGRPSSDRGNHLLSVGLPMLFIQGTRDKLAELDLLTPLLERVSPSPSVHIVEEGDHSFKVPKRAGKTHDQIVGEIADEIGDWVKGLTR